mgnify:CR=1 FL=1
MKVGLSFSRCIRDIVEARVEFDDVLVIVSRTDFDPHNDRHWEGIWNGYRYGGLSNPEWAGAEPTLSEMKKTGLILQLGLLQAIC